MSFKNSLDNILLEYRTLEDEVVDSFYIPALSEAVVYKRAVGFFSSSVLLQISKGLGTIASREGKIKLLISPQLDEKDYKAIKEGYELRLLVNDKLDKLFDEDIDFDQKIERFTLLSYLIAKDILDIKIAIVEEQKNDKAIYHEKLGVMIDSDGDILSFSGSANETGQAFDVNYECIDVYCSWKSDEAYQRCQIKDFRFDQMWDDSDKSLIVIPFPQVIKDKILKYNEYDKYDFRQLDIDLSKIHLKKKLISDGPSTGTITFHDYQELAINNWVKNNYRGIFDMATGTGKTFTGLGALCKLYNDKKRIVAVICAPYIHLVDQWDEEAKKFNINPIKCYGATDYKTKLKNQIQKFTSKRTNFICIITTNGTFQTTYMQEMIQKNIKDTVLIVDEAHNFGAMKISNYLDESYPYRLALSATLDRYGDVAGTQRLYDFFGEKSIEYSLERAIRERKLTKYYYHPVVVTLTDEEYYAYQKLTDKIKKFHTSRDEDDIPDALKTLLVARARIVAGAENKIAALKEVMVNYQKENNLLIYCGAVKYGEIGNEDIIGAKQIEIVKNMLNKELGIVATKFTSEEDAKTRKRIIDAYVNEQIQALVAIKCLDEGVNVPAIKTAFILASSANPKEYIQRRGRVLRKYPGKDFAEIYDFITLPRPLDDVYAVSESEKSVDIGLIQKELTRMIDFANLSNNPTECDNLIDEIKNTYNINTIRFKEDNLYE